MIPGEYLLTFAPISKPSKFGTVKCRLKNLKQRKIWDKTLDKCLKKAEIKAKIPQKENCERAGEGGNGRGGALDLGLIAEDSIVQVRIYSSDDLGAGTLAASGLRYLDSLEYIILYYLNPALKLLAHK